MNIMKKRKIALFLVTLLLISILSGCGQQDNQETLQEQKKTIVDMAGKSVEVPEKVEKIAVTCYGGASHEVAILGAGDKIVAQPPMQRFPQLVKMLPGFADVPDVGSFDEVNVEEILKLEPDVVIASVSSEKGNKKIEEAGIPVVTVLTGRADIEGLKKEFKMMGDLLNKEKEAEKLVAFWNERLKLIEDHVSEIPQDERKRVYYVLGDLLHTNGGSFWGHYLITTAGGINVAEEIGKARDISIEQLLEWDPEVMILSSNEGRFIPVEEVKNNPQMADVKAVKDNALHLCPVGTFWWDRPSPEAILGMTWLAKTLYPDKFTDIDLEKDIKDFYKEFYNYELTSDEVKAFLNPTE